MKTTHNIRRSSVKREVRKAISVLNRAIVRALKQGHYPEIDILGEADDWPEFAIRGWTKFPKTDD